MLYKSVNIIYYKGLYRSGSSALSQGYPNNTTVLRCGLHIYCRDIICGRTIINLGIINGDRDSNK